MAQKRMFDKSVVRRDDFLEMSISSQNLYFHLSMDADDDGFVDNWKSIIKITGAKEDDMINLVNRKFILPFDSGVLVIRHWRLNNYLRKDRYNETKYLDEKSQLTTSENEEYHYIKDMVYQLATSGIHSIEEKRREENRIEENSIEEDLFELFWKEYPKKREKGNAEKWFNKNKPKRKIVDTMILQINRFKDTKDWKKENGQFIPYPTSWLNAKMWEDEFETETEKELRIDKEIEDGIYGT